MPRIKFRWIVLILILLAAGFFVWHQTRTRPVSVVVKPVERGLVEKTVSNTRAGAVKACRRAKLSPGIGGQITKLPVRKGDRVVKGQLLMELWNEDLVKEIRFAEKEAEAMNARANAACFRAEIARREADRMVGLQKSDVVSLEQVDRAVTEANVMESECEASRTSVVMSRYRLGVIRANQERTRLTAPFDGIIAEINGELNEYVTPSPVGIPTPPAIDMVNNTCFNVAAPIDEVDAPLIQTGMAARITLDAFRGRNFNGKVRRVDVYVTDHEKQARTVDVEVEFTDPADMDVLLAGYSADVEIIMDVHPDALRIPTEAILDGNHVFVFQAKTGIIRKKTIAPGISNWDFTEVTSGLELTDQIIVNVDQEGIADGAAGIISGTSG